MKLLSAILLLATAPVMAQFTDITSGHFETQVDYDGGFDFFVSYNPTGDFNNGNADVRLDAASIRFVASPACQTTLPGGMAAIGTPGSTAWIMPQSPVIGAPYLGTRAVFPESVFYDYFMGNYFPFGTGSVRYIVTAVSGTGPASGGQFGIHNDSLGESTLFVNTADGLPDEIQALTANSHEHFSWVFTKPGTYDVQVTATGMLLANDSLVSGSGVYHFSVPFSSRLTGAGTVVRIGHQMSDASWHVMLEDPAASVAYRADQAFIEVPGGGSRQLPLSFSALGSSVLNFVGQSPALAGAGLPAGALAGDSVTFRLLEVNGPGAFSLLNAAGTLTLLTSSDGITAADAMEVGRASNVAALAAFTTDGLYRVTVRLEGVSTSGGEPVASGPVTLFFGVGLTAAHSYAQWADSFERTHGLGAGALSSASGDWDGDSLINAHEFLLFWHGCDPVRGDLTRLPVPVFASGVRSLAFLRDTYKDRQDGTGLSMSVQASPTLGNWVTRTLQNPGYPDQTFETGAETGNAHGRIMRRMLRIPGSAAASSGFARFHVSGF
jgi:surface-anchored protein